MAAQYKKLDDMKPELAQNVRKFIEKQKAERIQKTADALKKKVELLRLRKEHRNTLRAERIKSKCRSKKKTRPTLMKPGTIDGCVSSGYHCVDDHGFESPFANNIYSKIVNNFDSVERKNVQEVR